MVESEEERVEEKVVTCGTKNAEVVMDGQTAASTRKAASREGSRVDREDSMGN